MKKIFLLGALVASTMAFASMESNSVLDTLKSGSVTVKGGLIYDNLTTASVKYVDPTLKSGQTEANYKAAKNQAKIEDSESKALPSVGLGLEAEYSVPVYNINDDMSVLVAGGLQGGVEYNSESGNIVTPKYDSETHLFANGDSVDFSDTRLTTSVALFVAPKFEYKINDEIKVAGGVKLGLGGDFHTQLANDTLMKAIENANQDKAKDSSSKEKSNFGEDDSKPDAKKALMIAKYRSESHTAGTFVIPMGITADVNYNNIVMTVDLGGKLLIPNNKDRFSANFTQGLSYDTSKQSGKVTKDPTTLKASPKFNFAAGVKFGYRFDLDKFMK